MLIPSLNDLKIYDKFTKEDIIGLKISPCENFIVILTKYTIQIISNRHNRVLLAQKLINDDQNQINKIGFFNGLIEWSNNSKLLILGSSTQKHVFIYKLNLKSPLDIFHDQLYNNNNNNNNNNNSNQDNSNDVTNYININTDDDLNNNINNKYLFITEEIENNIINVPNIINDEIFENIQDDLLTFQLINQYGILNEKNEIKDKQFIEFSTSYINLELCGYINIYHKYDSFLILYNEINKEYVLLFSLIDYPILTLISINNFNIRKNIFLNDYITISNKKNINFNVSNNEYFNNDLFNIFKKQYIPLLPIYNLQLLKEYCISNYLNNENELIKEINLENLDRKTTINNINNILKNNEFKYPFLLDIDSNNKYFQSIIESFIENEDYIIKEELKFRNDYKGFGIYQLNYNENFDYISLLIKPWNFLLLFSWKNSFLKNFFLNYDKELNKDFLMGLIIEKNGILNYKLMNKSRRIVILRNKSIENNNSLIFNEELEYEICDDKLDNFEYNNKLNNDMINNKDILIEIITFNEYILKDNFNSNDINFKKIRLNCIFSIKISKLINNIILNNKLPILNISNSDEYILIIIENEGIIILDSFTGKISCKILIENFNNEKIYKLRLNNLSNKIDLDNENLNKEIRLNSINSGILISNDLSILFQIKDNNNLNRLIEIPIYRLINKKSSISYLEKKENNKFVCENLIFLGIDNIGIIQCNNRNLNLDSNNISDKLIESLNNLDLYINEDNLENKDLNNNIYSSYIYCNNLDIEFIPIPPSIYINHNWPIKEIFLNNKGDYLLLSGYRGCAIYDFLNKKWRLFCDVIHELILCKPNLPFGWINEYIFFLAVDSSLLLTTFHDIITSEEELWEISIFEKNRLYERYINNLKYNILRIKNKDNNINICFVFFDVRNTLDIKNIIGIIPFCSSIPLLIVNNNKNIYNSLIIYTSDFILTSYIDDKNSNIYIPIDIKWMIDLSEEWIIHPIEMLLLNEDDQKTIILILHNDRKLYILTIFHFKIEHILNKKCKYKIEPILDDNDIEKEYLINLDNINKFGFILLNNNEFNNDLNNNNGIDDNNNIHVDNIINNNDNLHVNNNNDDIDLKFLFDNINKIIYSEFDIKELNIKDIIFNENILNFIKNKIKIEDIIKKDKLLYLEDNFKDNFFGFIWYMNILQEIYILPISYDKNEINFNENELKRITNLPILVYSNQLNPYLIYLINFLPQFSSFFIFQSKKNFLVNLKKNIIKENELKVNFILNEICSPIIQELFTITNINKLFPLINKFLKPIYNYIKIYPFEEIFKILINIFENMIFIFIKDSCKDYKIVIKNVIEGIIFFLIENKLINNNNDLNNNNIEVISNYLNEIFLMLNINIKINDCLEENNIFNFITNKIFNNSWNIKQLIQILNFILKFLEINFDNLEMENIKIRIFTYLIISVIRKIDPLIAPCIIFPIINLTPIQLFQLCIETKNYNNAALYLILIQSYVGPYIVRSEYSLILLNYILSNINIINYDKLLILSNNIIKFIFLIFKPENINLNIPFSEQNEEFKIIGINNKDDLIDPFLIINRIQYILELSFISNLIQIEWINIIIICKYLNMNFNSWFKYCIQKYQPLWFEDNKINSTNYNLSSIFNKLVLTIQSKFHLFNMKKNTFSLFNEEIYQEINYEFDFDNNSSLDNISTNINNEYNPVILSLYNNINIIFEKENYFSKFQLNQIIKLFFKGFLSNSMPLPALAIAHACNDIGSVHKILNDFPDLK